MEQEIKALLEQKKAEFDAKVAGLDATIQTKAQEAFSEFETKMKTANEAEIKGLTERLDGVVAELKAKNTKVEVKTFETEFSKALESKSAELKDLGVGTTKLTLELKDVTLQTNNTLTGQANGAGGAVINQLGSVILPSQKVNFTDLIATVNGSQDTIRLWRETEETNTIARISKGAQKPEQELSVVPVDFTASYVAGIYKFEKSMMRNLPWMQQRLPEMLRRNFNKTINASFYATLYTAATAATTTATNRIVRLVEAIAQAENSDFDVNGIILNPADFASISVNATNDGEFTLPGTVVFSNGRLTINGVPVFKATWVTVDQFILGDWSQAYKYTTDTLKVQYFDQDVDNVQKNAITTRIEESNVLVIEQPKAFIKGVLTQPAG
jgi:HK97 family phage major capsid protein